MDTICDTCQKRFSTKTNKNKHIRNVHGVGYNITNTCECGKSFDNYQSLNAHFRWCKIHRKGIDPIPSWLKGKQSPFKGKKLEEIVNNADEVRRKLSIANKGRPGKPHTQEAKEKISKGRIAYLESDKSHISWFTVNNIKVQGTWEKKIAEKLLSNKITFSRIRIKYDNYRTYTPDFYLDELKIFIEVKGWLSNNDKNKYRKVFNDNPELKIFLIRDELGINNFTKFLNDEISIFDCEDLKTVIMGS